MTTNTPEQIYLTLSANGQVTLPPSICQAQQWKAGQSLVIIVQPEGLFIKSQSPFPPTTLKEVAGCLAYQGPPKTLEDMENAIATELQERAVRGRY
jgi:bifunctional DNA-binding transcriptional regulator/antitoxin component of YhaV-PrlF toxin-antitoxin module